MKIAMVASECNPLIKTGGLADVIFALSKELVKKGEEVIIVLPYYKKIHEKYRGNVEYITSYSVYLSWRQQECKVFKTIIDNVSFYLLDNDQYFNRDALYGEMDDGERFAFFTLAAKELFQNISYTPDIIHVHDWHPGMLPSLIKEEYPRRKIFEKTKFVLTIHNPAFQGLYDRSVLGNLYNLTDALYDCGKVRFKDCVSTLKAAIIYADKISCVSPTNREELLRPQESMGLNDILWLREWDFCGIANGIDTNEFDPRNDALIPAKMNSRNLLDSKRANKESLLKAFRLTNDANKPLFSLVSRLTWQKGVNLIIPTCYKLCEKGCSIIVLGSGEFEAEEQFEELRRRYPNQVGIYIGYNGDLAHLIYAGSDFFMMPSLFEPCGIGQMIAERYATLPIVRRTGGLKDTVIGYDGTNLKKANGYGFDEYSVDAFANTCIYALDNYYDENIHPTLMKNAFKVDNSWEKSAELYLGLYKGAIGGNY